MRALDSRFVVPVASFLAAVALSWLGAGPVGLVLARQAGGSTPCTGSATGVSITVAAGSGIKKGTPGWTFSITDQPINVVNSKTAGLTVSDLLTIDMEDVVGIDTDHKKHPFGKQTLVVAYQPVPVYDNNNLPPPGSAVNAIPATITIATILQRLEHQVAGLLPGVTFTKVTGTLKAQTTLTDQLITIICSDGTELTANPRPQTKLPVDNKGDGKAVKN